MDSGEGRREEVTMAQEKIGSRTLSEASSLPSLSRSGSVIRTASSIRHSATLMSDFVGFVCCDKITCHSYDSKFTVIQKVQPPAKIRECSAVMNQPLNPRYITSSLRFESQLYSATNRILQLPRDNLTHALRSITYLSSLEEVALIRSVLASQKSKFAELMNKSVNAPISMPHTDQQKWRLRCAADSQSLSLVSDRSLYRKDLELRKFDKDGTFSLLNWYHASNGLERREFLCRLINQFDLATTRLYSDIIADGQYRDFLRKLPESVVRQIIGYLNPTARGRLSVVNHAYYQLIDSMKSPVDAATVTRLIELDNPMPSVPSFQKAFTELKSRENLRAGKFCRITELEGHIGRIHCVTIWRNYIASGGADKTVRIWTVSTGKQVCALIGHQGGVWCLQFFAKSMLLSGSFDATIRLWSVKRARCLRELRGHNGAVWALKVEGNYLLSGSQDKVAVIWDSVRGEPLHYLTAHKEAVFTVDLCCADRLAITGSADRTVKLWALDDGQLLRSITVGAVMSVTAVCYSRGYVAAASSTLVKVFQLIQVNVAKKSNENGKQGASNRTIIVSNHWVDFDEEHSKRIESLSFRISNSNSSQLDGVLITSSKDGLVKYWDLSQKTSLQTFKPLFGGVVNCVHFDAYRVAVAGDNSKVRLYDFSLSQAALRGAGFGTQSKPKQPKTDSKKADQQTVTFAITETTAE